MNSFSVNLQKNHFREDPEKKKNERKKISRIIKEILELMIDC